VGRGSVVHLSVGFWNRLAKSDFKFIKKYKEMETIMKTLKKCILALAVLAIPVSTFSSTKLALAQSQGNFSFQSYNIPNLYIRHRNGLGEVSEIKSDLDRQDATFRLVPGLANRACNSFRATNRNLPGHYLRHQDGRIKLQRFESNQLFKEDATFCIKPGLADQFVVSFASYNYPNYYIRHRNYALIISRYNRSDQLFLNDASFRRVSPFAP